MDKVWHFSEYKIVQIAWYFEINTLHVNYIVLYYTHPGGVFPPLAQAILPQKTLARKRSMNLRLRCQETHVQNAPHLNHKAFCFFVTMFLPTPSATSWALQQGFGHWADVLWVLKRSSSNSIKEQIPILRPHSQPSWYKRLVEQMHLQHIMYKVH